MPTPFLERQLRMMGAVNRIIEEDGNDEVLSQEAVQTIAEQLTESDPQKMVPTAFLMRAMTAMCVSHERCRIEHILARLAPIAK